MFTSLYEVICDLYPAIDFSQPIYIKTAQEINKQGN